MLQPPLSRSRIRRLAVRVGVAAASAALFVGIVEASVRILASAGAIDAPPLGAADDFWNSDHPTFGVWHAPEQATRHSSDCFDVLYQTNSVGARDRERTERSDAPRVVVLGDSFVEGWGLATDERLSDQLEQRTELEHLNFGMSHFSPYQAVLAYRELGLRFAHDAVLLAVVPASDFADLDVRRAMRMPTYDYRYRPYLVGEYPDFEEIHLREQVLARWLRRNSFGYNALSGISAALRERVRASNRNAAGVGATRMVARATDDARSDRGASAEPEPTHSFFHDYSPRLLDLLRSSIERLKAAAGGRSVAVALVPQMRDLVRYDESGTSPLGSELGELLAPFDVRVVDLLPELYRRRSDLTRYFLTCEIHWSGEANEVASEAIAEMLADSFYARRPVR